MKAIPKKVTQPRKYKNTRQKKLKTDEKTLSNKLKGTTSSPKFYHQYDDLQWEGLEEESGSVGSGILEEDICLECGKSTISNPELFDQIIICDICDAEYHLSCLGLDKIPQGSFECNNCLNENQLISTFDIVLENFPIPKFNIKSYRVYSPSKPLCEAWEEFQKRGIMVVSKIFPLQIIKLLMTKCIEKYSHSGRVIDSWHGSIEEINKRVSSSSYHNVVDRDGRYDLKLPSFVIEELQLCQYLEPILARLKMIMGTPSPEIRTQSIVFVPVGSKAQEWHADHSLIKNNPPRYFTILIQLNPIDSACGGTEIFFKESNKGDLIRPRPGDGLVFDGSLWHRGQANIGYHYRYFYYASFSCSSDLNL